MQEQPSVYPRQFLIQQQQGGGGKYKKPKKSKKEKKEEKKAAERQEQLYNLQTQQMQQAQTEAAQARRSIENQNRYQSVMANADTNLLSYFSAYDPQADYGNKATVKNLLSGAQSRYAEAQKKEAEEKAEMERKAEEERIRNMVAPLPTEYSLEAEEASQGARRREKKRVGLGKGTVFAGETGGYNTDRKTLLG